MGWQSAAHPAVHRHARKHTVRSESAELRRRGPGLVPWSKHLAIGWRGGFADELRRVHPSADIGEGTREGAGGWRSATGRSAACKAPGQSLGEQLKELADNYNS